MRFPSLASRTRNATNSKEKAVKTRLVGAALAFIAAGGVAFAASGALAQDTDTITVQTTVAAYCSSLDPLEANALALGELVGVTGFLNEDFAGTSTATVAGYYCNAPATVTLDAEPLIRTPSVTVSDTASFTDRVDYVASLAWGSIAETNSSTAAANTFSTTAPTSGDMTITVADPVANGNRRPIAGAYEGSVVITIAVP